MEKEKQRPVVEEGMAPSGRLGGMSPRKKAVTAAMVAAAMLAAQAASAGYAGAQEAPPPSECPPNNPNCAPAPPPPPANPPPPAPAPNPGDNDGGSLSLEQQIKRLDLKFAKGKIGANKYEKQLKKIIRNG